MCCEICKLGMAVGSTNTFCQSMPFFHSHKWDEVYQSCCSIANNKVKLISTEIIKKYDTTGQLNLYIFRTLFNSHLSSIFNYY